MNYRKHPILESLTVNEDGTSIIYQGEALTPKTYERKSKCVPIQMVTVCNKSVTVMRLVCECWHGMPENLEFVVKKIDQAKGNHYSNLCWSKQGLGLSHNSKSNFGVSAKLNEAAFKKLKSEKDPTESLTAFLKRKKIGKRAYYTARNKYEKSN
jgi:hypothetical protein